jgi:hypothetical protein
VDFAEFRVEGECHHVSRLSCQMIVEPSGLLCQFIGMSYSGMNLSYSSCATISRFSINHTPSVPKLLSPLTF